MIIFIVFQKLRYFINELIFHKLKFSYKIERQAIKYIE